jgi:hypothetical protein
MSLLRILLHIAFYSTIFPKANVFSAMLLCYRTFNRNAAQSEKTFTTEQVL